MSRIQTPPVRNPHEHGHPDPASCQMARRVQSSYAELMARLDFVPTDALQRAGLSAYYNSNNWAFLHVTFQEGLGRCLKLTWCDHGRLHEMPVQQQLPGTETVHLGVRFAYGYLQFYVSVDGVSWRDFGEPLRDSVLSAATGTFVMLCSQDRSGARPQARFAVKSDQEYRAPENLRGAQMFMLQPFPFVRPRAHQVHHTASLMYRS